MPTTVLHTETGRNRLPLGTHFVRRSKGVALGLRVGKLGSAWVGRYQASGAKPVFITLGDLAKMTHDQAAKACDAWAESQATGKPTPGERRTVADLVHFYLEWLTAEGQDASRTTTERMLRQHLIGRPAITEPEEGQRRRHGCPVHPLAMRPCDDLFEDELRKWKNELRGYKGKPVAPATVDRVIACLIAALNYGVSKRYIPETKAIEWRQGLRKSHKGNRRTLVLEPKQIRRFIDAFETQALVDLVEAVAVTGARVGEIRNARAEDFDARRGMLTLTGKTGTRVVPVTDEALRLFRRLHKDKLPKAWLVPNESGEQFQPTGGAFHRAIKAAAKAAKLPAETNLYTLRHSWITHALSGSKPLALLTVARLVGTSIDMIEKNYGHLNMAERDAIRATRIAS